MNRKDKTMNELQVQVQQQPGVIQWNFEDLKAALLEEMQKYELTVYTDETISNAKKDVAYLRKLKKAVEDKRIEIKNRCLEPYEVIEQQAKELNALIEKPITVINEKVDEYETRRKEAAKKVIMAYMQKSFEELPADIAEKAACAVWNPKWLNKTAKADEWKIAITKKAEEIGTALQMIEDTDPDYKEVALETYKANLDMTEAMAKIRELKHQKELLEERQRQREEQERRRREAEAARIRAEQEERECKAKITLTKESMAHAVEIPVDKSNEINDNVVTTQYVEPTKEDVVEAAGQVESVVNARHAAALCIAIYESDSAKIKKVLDYIKFAGIKYEVMTAKDWRC